MKDAIMNLRIEWYKEIFGNVMGLGSIVRDSLIGGTTGTVTDIVVEKGKEIMMQMQGIGMAIAVLFFLISLVELTTQDRMNIEVFVKFFAKLAIAFGVILYLDKIVAGVYEFGSALTGVIEYAGAKIDMNNEIENAIRAEDASAAMGLGNVIVDLLKTIISMFPMLILSSLLILLCYIISFSRIIELGVRTMFLPIAVALISDDGWRGAGGRYIRKFVALVCQAAVLVGIAVITDLALKAAATASIGKLGGMSQCVAIMVGCSIACVAMMFKSIGIVNDIFGA